MTQLDPAIMVARRKRVHVEDTRPSARFSGRIKASRGGDASRPDGNEFVTRRLLDYVLSSRPLTSDLSPLPHHVRSPPRWSEFRAKNHARAWKAVGVEHARRAQARREVAPRGGCELPGRA